MYIKYIWTILGKSDKLQILKFYIQKLLLVNISMRIEYLYTRTGFPYFMII